MFHNLTIYFVPYVLIIHQCVWCPGEHLCPKSQLKRDTGKLELFQERTVTTGDPMNVPLKKKKTWKIMANRKICSSDTKEELDPKKLQR